MKETTELIPIQHLSTDQLQDIYNRYKDSKSNNCNLEIAERMMAIQAEIKDREFTANKPSKSFRWDIVTYSLVAILAIVCGLQLRSIFQSVKCPSQHILTEQNNVN